MGKITTIGVVFQDALDCERVELPEWELEILITRHGNIHHHDPLTILIMIEEDEEMKNEQNPK